ncbi:pirin family protein [Nocardioides psychrotolerans]|uniref:pirin family protein n=1 Tax=Nocardioides psychrotolerans TaxID=1005945 RepID=UPI001479249F|nr:pirin family protein [Nocardioides psychrotolerans]
MTVEIRRASARFVDKAPGRITHHAFAFGQHYDPDHLGFGPMVCHDDHLLGSSQGFDTHRHADLEIVSWMVSGALEHREPSSAEPVRVGTGTVARLSAGAGVDHAEHSHADGPTRFVQVWLTPDHSGGDPSYDVGAVPLVPNELVVVASGEVDAPVRIDSASATFLVARLDAGVTLDLPDADGVHVFVATGALTRSSMAEPLSQGDAFLIRDAVGVSVTAALPTELLVWTFAGLRDSRTGESGSTRALEAGGPDAGDEREIVGTELRLTGSGAGSFALHDAEGALPADYDYLYARLGLGRDLFEAIVIWGESWAQAPGLPELQTAARVILARLDHECSAFTFDLRL